MSQLISLDDNIFSGLITPVTRKLVSNFESKFGNFWVHFEHQALRRTTNIIEGIIRQLSRKIDDTRMYADKLARRKQRE